MMEFVVNLHRGAEELAALRRERAGAQAVGDGLK